MKFFTALTALTTLLFMPPAKLHAAAVNQTLLSQSGIGVRLQRPIDSDLHCGMINAIALTFNHPRA